MSNQEMRLLHEFYHKFNIDLSDVVHVLQILIEDRLKDTPYNVEEDLDD